MKTINILFIIFLMVNVSLLFNHCNEADKDSTTVKGFLKNVCKIANENLDKPDIAKQKIIDLYNKNKSLLNKDINDVQITLTEKLNKAKADKKDLDAETIKNIMKDVLGESYTCIIEFQEKNNSMLDISNVLSEVIPKAE